MKNNLSKRNKKSLLQKIYAIKLRCLKLLNTSKVKSLYGVYLSSNFGDTTFKYYVCGSYGENYWKHIESKNEKFLYLDIGANQGLYTLCASRNKNCIKAYAFEPVMKTFELLESNIKLNNLSHKCNLIQKAVSDESGIAQIKKNKNHSGVASIISGKLNENETNIEEIITIDGKGLDDIVINVNNTPIIVKIDVEGFEKSVILGLINSNLMTYVTEIFYEVDEKWVNAKELEFLLREVGFSNFEKIGDNESHYDILVTK